MKAKRRPSFVIRSDGQSGVARSALDIARDFSYL